MKKTIFIIIQPDKGNSLASRIFDWMITSLILISVITLFVVTFDLPDSVRKFLLKFEAFVSIVFTIEYCMRLYTADMLFPHCSPIKARLKYVVSAMALVDLLAILPYWLPMFLPSSMLGLRSLRLLRLLRILKLNRYFTAVKTIGDVLSDKRRELLGSMFFVAILMVMSSLLMYSAEHGAQPEVFKNAFSGLWWAVATLTTVGYGDVYPVTVMGRVLGIFIALSGIAAVAIPTGIITAGLTERLGRDAKLRKEVARQRGKDDEHDKELDEQRRKDVEHDKQLEVQQLLLKQLIEQITEIKEELRGK